MYPEFDLNFYLKLQKSVVVLCGVVIAVGLMVICGWWWDIDMLKCPIPRLVAMNPLTAICFICAATALLRLLPLSVSWRRHAAGILLAGFTLIASILRLVDYLPGQHLSVDMILFHSMIGTDTAHHLSTRMSPTTATLFIFLSIALIGLHGSLPVRRYMVPVLAYMICIGAGVTALDYIYGVQVFYGHLAFFPMAIHTAFCFLFLGLSLLFARPVHGGIEQIASAFSGGTTGRLLITAAVIVPFTLGFMALYGYWTGYFTPELAIAALVFLLIIILCLLIWRNTREINHRESEQAATSRSLAQANRSLTQMNEELDRFAYISSHDLQEPLRKIRIFSNMIRADKTKPGFDTDLYAGKITEASDRMSGLIRDLLSFSKMQRSDAEFRDTDLSRSLARVLLDYELAIAEKKAVITSSHLPTIHAIPMQMDQLLYNIIGNALKFSAGEPLITIDARIADRSEVLAIPTLDSGYQYLLLTVADNGIGFEQQYADKIFVVFQRLTTDSSYSGSGIGLAICKKIVDNHSGHIRATSIPGSGTTFEIFLRQ